MYLYSLHNMTVTVVYSVINTNTTNIKHVYFMDNLIGNIVHTTVSILLRY